MITTCARCFKTARPRVTASGKRYRATCIYCGALIRFYSWNHRNASAEHSRQEAGDIPKPPPLGWPTDAV